MKPMLTSLSIIGFIIIIEILSFVLSLYQFSGLQIHWLRKLSLAALLFMYLLQLYAIIYTFLPIFHVKRKSSLENKKHKKRNKILRKNS